MFLINSWETKAELWFNKLHYDNSIILVWTNNSYIIDLIKYSIRVSQ